MNILRSVTERGFKVIEFIDRYEQKCNIQKSSQGDAIWLGIEKAEPKILASKIMDGGTGWVSYPIHEDVMINTRMHLTVDQVRELLPILQKFVDTGKL
ncbi:MAG: hypothetical protein M0P49_00995 [Bacilli bacterium]|nr:hypothetical protein [Bacilli bacterium]